MPADQLQTGTFLFKCVKSHRLPLWHYATHLTTPLEMQLESKLGFWLV